MNQRFFLILQTGEEIVYGLSGKEKENSEPSWLHVLIGKKGRNDNGLLDCSQLGDVRRNQLKLREGHMLLASKPLRQWFPERVEILNPPSRDQTLS